jgi:hypothetical protein
MAEAAETSSVRDELGGLWPGLAAAAGCGLTAVGRGPLVALAVAGLAALPLGLLSWSAATTRGPSERPAGSVAVGVAVSLAVPVLAVFGALLKANTHHRALAGVTFAVVGLGVALGSVAAGARAAVIVRERLTGERQRAAGLVALGVAGLLCVAVLGSRVLSSADLVLALGAGLGGALLGPRRGPGLAAAGAFVVLIAAGVGVSVASPDVARAVHERGQLAAKILRPLVPAAGAAPASEGEPAEGN